MVGGETIVDVGSEMITVGLVSSAVTAVAVFSAVFTEAQDAKNNDKVITKSLIRFIFSVSQIISVKTKRKIKSFGGYTLRNFIVLLNIVCYLRVLVVILRQPTS